jgi:cytochrome c
MRSKLSLAAACFAVAALSFWSEACGNAGAKQAASLTGGDAERGRAAIFKYGCGACHTIGGITNAHGLVGPPLTGIANRSYLGGVLPNTPVNIVRWIQNPHEFKEKTAMPALGVSSQDAEDIAAYLYSTK